MSPRHAMQCPSTSTYSSTSDSTSTETGIRRAMKSRRKLISQGRNNAIDALARAIRRPHHNQLRLPLEAVPIYSPEDRTQSVTIWLEKLEELSQIYKWNDNTKIYYCTARLQGLASTWYRGLTSIRYTWEEWKTKLLRAFPDEEDYCKLLEDMLHRKKRSNESLLRYYYEKTAMINSCGLSGRRAVSCIIGGVQDPIIRATAKAGAYNVPEDLLQYFKTLDDDAENSMNQRSGNSSRYHQQNCGKYDHQSRPPVTRNSCRIYKGDRHEQPMRRDEPRQRSPTLNRPTNSNNDTNRFNDYRCYICNKKGHFARNCRQRNEEPNK